VDVGCGSVGLRALDSEHEIVGLDARPQPDYPGELVVADARAMPFADGEFDVAYCNSLIEHVDPEDRALVAVEVRRVARRWFVQTPNRWFPIEPHVLLPGYQFLPEALQRRLAPLGAGGGYERIRMLDARELQGLFPNASILRERVGPLTKSLMAVGPDAPRR
jgi:SAM-dependent methyltransferase